MNGYTYADDNPVMNRDPDGHWAWAVVNAGFAVYDGYKAYKAGKNKKQIAWAVASSFVKIGHVKKAGSALKAVNKNRKWKIGGISKDNGRIFAIINRKKKATKSTDSRKFALDYHHVRENKKRTTRKVLHVHWNYKKNKHYFIYPSRKKTKWK